MKVQMLVDVDVVPYKALVEPLDRFHATAKVRVINSDLPVKQTEFQYGPAEAKSKDQAIAIAVAWALDRLNFKE